MAEPKALRSMGTNSKQLLYLRIVASANDARGGRAEWGEKEVSERAAQLRGHTAGPSAVGSQLRRCLSKRGYVRAERPAAKCTIWVPTEEARVAHRRLAWHTQAALLAR